ncbi:MAG TPA: uroporphyrinogen-III synthase [Kofleriaceae bacterium]|jgi:uroporphyrinogen-III synthase
MPRAVLTRDDVAAYAAALASLGLDAVAMPVTRTAPPPDPGALAKALADEYDAIVVASRRAADAIAAAGTPHGEVWAVGPATLRALADAGIGATYPSEARDGESLARAIVASAAGRGVIGQTQPMAGKRVLLPRSEGGRAEAAEVLRAAGADVVEVIAYRTIAAGPVDVDVLRECAVCVVFAPSQVAALAPIVRLADLLARFVAIGETTASALRAVGVRPAVAEAPTPEGIARAVASVYPPRL